MLMRKKKSERENIDSKLPTLQRRKQRFRESRQLTFRYMACEQRTKVIDTLNMSGSMFFLILYLSNSSIHDPRGSQKGATKGVQSCHKACVSCISED